jgi:hypothetical protein
MERTTQVGSSQAMERRRKVVQPRRWLSWGKSVGGSVGKSAEQSLRLDAEPLGEVDDPMLPRKSSSEVYSGPYPKPTQVVR